MGEGSEKKAKRSKTASGRWLKSESIVTRERTLFTASGAETLTQHHRRRGERVLNRGDELVGRRDAIAVAEQKDRLVRIIQRQMQIGYRAPAMASEHRLQFLQRAVGQTLARRRDMHLAHRLDQRR